LQESFIGRLKKDDAQLGIGSAQRRDDFGKFAKLIGRAGINRNGNALASVFAT
jgi:hypothetical protein